MTDKHAVELASRLKSQWNPYNNSRPPTADEIIKANREGRLTANGFENRLEIRSDNASEKFKLSENGKASDG